MDITNVKIYDMMESIVASGLPMMAEYDEKWFATEVENLTMCENVKENPHFKRMCRLANNPVGSGHCNALSGILVSANVTATVKWWEQFQRYHFKQITSSMSSMHRLRTMMQNGTIKFNPNTNKAVISKFMALLNDETVTDEELAYSCPMGLELTARIATNYLQLRTIFQQRKEHKLSEWHTVCNFIAALPFAAEFITGANK